MWVLSGLKEQQQPGESIAKAVETLSMILSFSDKPEKLNEIMKRVDSSLLAVVKANAVTARQEGQLEIADELDRLAGNLENIITRRILAG